MMQIPHKSAGSISWDDRIFDVPACEPTEEYHQEDVRAHYYRCLPFKGRETRCFAYMGFPKDASPERPMPGVVLVHGGGGTATANWVRIWNARGYAAISMEYNGRVPDPSGKASGAYNPLHGPTTHGFVEDIDKPLEEQWAYHAISNVILAHSLLRSFPQVDADRVGMVGGSWGGIMTCYAHGIDHRLAFGVPVYGCGHLELGFAPFRAERDQNLAIGFWDPRNFLPNGKFPMLWVNNDYDDCFAPQCTFASFADTRQHASLCFLPGLFHDGPPHVRVQEIFAFADQHAKGGIPLPRITAQRYDPTARTLSVSYHAERGAYMAYMRIIRKEIVMDVDRYPGGGGWFDVNLYLDPRETDGGFQFKVDKDVWYCYANVCDAAGLQVSSDLYCTRK